MTSLFTYVWRNSAREQIKILLIVLASFPFYYLSLDIPKYIISDALQGRAFSSGNTTVVAFGLTIPVPFSPLGSLTIFKGVELERQSYLLALSGLFLILVIINGAFKYVVNMRKGALGERLLQRLRFDLFSALLTFTPEAMQRLKPAEAASIIKDEVEPIGGFVGDAFVQPMFLGGQALTAIVFILVQNVLLGVIAVLMVVAQALIIPRLRREQIRLGKQRQIASRAFAGKIGEVVETLGEVSNHGTSAVERGLVAQRLEILFGIRYRLYGRKFAVKALNNLLAQMTPFMFYTVGGYAALSGQLGIGQLVAVIAAYRDLPPPVKELIDWDQQRLDVEAKFQQVTEQFLLAAATEPPASPDVPVADFPRTGQIVAQSLSVTSATGDRLLDRVSLTLPLGRHVAVSGRGEGGGCFAQVLGGRMTPTDGVASIGGFPVGALPPDMRGRSLAYLGSEPAILDSSLRENILYGLRRAQADSVAPPGWIIDHKAADAPDHDALEQRLIAVLRTVGLAESVFRYGLARKLGADDAKELVSQVAEIRARIRSTLAARDAQDVIEPYEPSLYARNATIGENVLFGVPHEGAITVAKLAGEVLTGRILDELALTEDLAEMGRRIAATMLEIFRDLTPDHVLFEQFSFIAAEEFPEYRERLARAEADASDENDRARFIGLAFLYIEPLHRLGLLDESLERRLLVARQAFRSRATSEMTQSIAFYDPKEYCVAASLRENMLFGRVVHGTANGRERADEAILDTLVELGLDRQVYRLGLDHQAGYAGRLLFPTVKAQVALARCLIKQPAMLILDNAFNAFSQTEAKAMITRIRDAMAGRSLIVVGREFDHDRPFDLSVVFDGAKLVSAPGARPTQVLPAASQPDPEPGDNDEVRALQAVPIFANLDIARIKLLAFTSERAVFEAGDVLFSQGDESDAAYVTLSGSADVLIGPPGRQVRVSQIEGHAIVGEMGVITGDVRSASIVATTPLAALKLRKEVFLALMGEFPEMALSVTRLMVKRLHNNVATISAHEREGR